MAQPIRIAKLSQRQYGDGVAESQKPNPSPPARVLVVDDNQFVRVGLQATLRGADDLEVVGEAANGEEALHLCHALRPDVVITDLRMPVMDGLAAATAIKSAFPQMVVIVLTIAEVTADEQEAAHAGADMLLPKDISRADLLRHIRRLLSTARNPAPPQ